MFGAAPVFAQEAPPATAQNAQGPGPNQDIIVTAQRRSERLQDVPISVTAITAADIARSGGTNTEDLTSLVPGLVFTRSTQSGQPTVRGIGTRNGATGDEANVPIYIDGVYQAQPFGNVFDLADVEQVEVLAGPQVTLYGRNATGGAINIRTRAPSFTTVGSFSATYGSYDYHSGTAYLSGPLNKTIAASIMVDGFADHGYIHNVLNNETYGNTSSISVRGKVLWRPSDRFDLTLNGFYMNANFPETYAGHYLNGNSLTRILPNPNGYTPQQVDPTGNYETAGVFRPLGLVKTASGGANANYDLGFAKLNWLADYRAIKGNQEEDLDATALDLIPAQIIPQSHSLYTEATLTSSGKGEFTWIIGTNYFNDKTQTDPQTIFPSTITNYGVKTGAYSAYAEGTLSPVDKIFLTAGIRYSTERKDAFYRQLDAEYNPISGESVGAGKRWGAWTPRVVARYEISDANNVYASFSQGFKSGTFDASSAIGAITPVNPEHVNAYEVGVKTRLTRGIILNGAIFHYNYKDLQVSSLFSGINDMGMSYTYSSLGNAAQARINGAELTGNFNIFPNLGIQAGVSYLDAKFTSFPNASYDVPNIINGLPSGNVSVFGNLAGKELMRAPKYTFRIAADYTVRDVFGGSLLLNGSVFRSALYWADVNNRVNQPAYTQVDASVTWRLQPKKGWFLRVQGKNLTSAKIVTSIFVTGVGDEETLQKPANWLATIGLDF